MRHRLKQILSDSFYRRTLYIYSLFTVLLTVAILITLSSVTTQSIRETAAENSQVLLGNLANTSHYIKSDVDTLMSTVANDSNTTVFVKSKRERKVINYYLHQKLVEYKSIYSYILDISVINLETNTSIQALGTNVNGNVNLSLAQEALKTEISLLPRQIETFKPNQTYDVISFLYRLPYDNSMVIVDVDAARFRLGIPESDADSRETAIWTESGQWLVYPDHYGTLGLSREYLENTLSENRGSASQFSVDDSKHGLMLFFSRSNELGWWFVDAQSYSYFFSTYTTISLWFLGVIAVFLLLCCTLAMLFNRRFQRPLAKLLEKYKAEFAAGTGPRNEIQYLDRVIANVEHERWLSDRYVASLYLRNVLLGHDMPFFFSRERQAALQGRFHAAYYCVLLLRIEADYSIPEDNRAEEMNMLRYTVCNFAGEIFGEEYRCEASDLDNDLAAVILLLESAQISQDYQLCFRKLRDFADSHMRVLLRGSLGPVTDSFEGIQASCAQARHYLDMDGLISAGSLIDSQTVSESSYQEKNRKLVESIQAYTQENFNDPRLSLKSISDQFGLSTTYLGKIFKSISGVSYSSFVTSCRLEQAKLALVETNKTVNEVAEEVGFSNSTYFATVFKSAYGITPTAYRNNARK